MQSVTLGYDEGGSLALANPKRGESGELWWITATVEQDGLRASTQVESHYAACFDDLVEFLEEMASAWHGWDGTKTYVSLERDLEISAVDDGVGRVHLALVLKGPNPPYEWTVNTTILTDPGTQMERAAADARVLLARTT